MGKYAPTDPSHTFPNRPIPPEASARAHARHTVDTETGCWISDYAPNPVNGYAAISWRADEKTRATTAHRASFTHANGPIADGMVIDHLCHNRRCVNPAHLRALTRGENARRQGEGDFPLGQCRNGHPLTEMRERLSGVSKGMKYCGACQKIRNDALAARRKAEIVSLRESASKGGPDDA